MQPRKTEKEAGEQVGTLAGREERLGWLLMVPALAVVVFVAFYPLFNTFYASFFNATLGSNEPWKFVGLKNYATLLADPTWWKAVVFTIEFTVIAVALETTLGMVVALVVNSNFRGRGLMRTAMLVPWAMITVVTAQMWRWMYNDVFGVVNDMLVRILHILPTDVAWLASPSTAPGALIAVDVWKTTPFMALMLLAGLQMISADLYEAASVDGASPLRQFFSITLPLVRPALVVALIFRTLDSLRIFDLIFVATGGGFGTNTMAVFAQRHLVDFQQLGYGSAIMVAIFIVIGIFVALYVYIAMGRGSEV